MVTTDELRIEMRKVSPHKDAMEAAVTAATAHGPSHQKVATALHVPADTVGRWAKRHPAIAEALKAAKLRSEDEKSAVEDKNIHDAEQEVARANAAVIDKQKELFQGYAGMDYVQVQRTEASCVKAREPLVEAKKRLAALRSAKKARLKRLAEKTSPKEEL
jgi:succinate dehydrogenase/fumarate reductase flavoprotein subunit